MQKGMSFLYEIVCYAKGMSFHMGRVFPCGLVYYVKRMGFLCGKGFLMRKKISYLFNLCAPTQN